MTGLVESEALERLEEVAGRIVVLVSVVTTHAGRGPGARRSVAQGSATLTLPMQSRVAGGASIATQRGREG